MVEPDNLTLEHLRALRAQGDRIVDEIKGLNGRMLAVEQHMAAVHLDNHTIRLDLTAIKERLDRIETRLGLIEV